MESCECYFESDVSWWWSDNIISLLDPSRPARSRSHTRASSSSTSTGASRRPRSVRQDADAEPPCAAACKLRDVIFVIEFIQESWGGVDTLNTNTATITNITYYKHNRPEFPYYNPSQAASTRAVSPSPAAVPTMVRLPTTTTTTSLRRSPLHRRQTKTQPGALTETFVLYVSRIWAGALNEVLAYDIDLTKR